MKTFAEINPELISKLKREDLAPLNAFGEWSFTEGPLTPGWENERRPGVSFHLDACQNLDALSKGTPVSEQSEGAVYGNVGAESDGIVLLGIGADWWFEAYCNGVLVADTFQTGNIHPLITPENHYVFMPVHKGDNLLAVRIRRGTASWNFACSPGIPFTPPPEPAITYGPWLTNVDCTTATVNFCCNIELGFGVEYRLRGTDEWQLVWHHRQGQILRRTFHAVHLKELTPGAEYEYRLVCIHPSRYIKTVVGDVKKFHVPDSTSSRFSFFFTADLQFSLPVQHKYFGKMLEAADAQSCDFFVLDGDVNSAFLPMDVIAGPFQQLQDYDVSEKPLVYIRGNHEMRGKYGDHFLDYFANQDGTTYGIFRYGDTAFMIIDSWEDKPAGTPGHPYCKWNLDDVFIEAETQWLEKAVKDERWTSAKRRIVFCHGAPYSHHDSCKTIPFVLQKMTDKYFEGKEPSSRLNLWMAGHVHHYLRSVPGTSEIASTNLPLKPFKDGTTYVYPVLTVGGPTKRSKTQASCFRVDLDEDGMMVQAWDENGELMEKVRILNDGSTTEIKGLNHFSP